MPLISPGRVPPKTRYAEKVSGLIDRPASECQIADKCPIGSRPVSPETALRTNKIPVEAMEPKKAVSVTDATPQLPPDEERAQKIERRRPSTARRPKVTVKEQFDNMVKWWMKPSIVVA